MRTDGYIQSIYDGKQHEGLDEMRRVQNQMDSLEIRSNEFEDRLIDLAHARMRVNPHITIDQELINAALERWMVELKGCFREMVRENFRLREINLDLERKISYLRVPLGVG